MKLADLSAGPDWVVYVGFKKKRQNIMKRSYAGQWDLECLLSQFLL